MRHAELLQPPPLRTDTEILDWLERQGQADLVAAAAHLPAMLSGSGYSLADIAANLGFVFGETLPDDPLFRTATLPPGWTLQATNHAMHSDLLDAQGRPRGSVFYKAAFYDRRADWRLLPRYVVFSTYDDNGAVTGVMDAADHTWVFQAGEAARDENMTAADWATYSAAIGRHDAEARQWLATQYPEHANVFAYWN